MKVKAAIILQFVFLIALTVSSSAQAEQLQMKEPEVIRMKEHVNGEVVSVDSKMISVLYKRTTDAEYETLIPLDQKMKLNGYKQASGIKVGDIVNLEYEKTIESPKTPEERMTKIVKLISFVKRPSQSVGLSSEEKKG